MNIQVYDEYLDVFSELRVGQLLPCCVWRCALGVHAVSHLHYVFDFWAHHYLGRAGKKRLCNSQNAGEKLLFFVGV